MSKNLICIGKITSAHGIKGQVKVASFTDNSQDIAIYNNPVFKDNSSIELKITSSKGNVLIAWVNDIANRNDAEKLRGKEIFVDRLDFPETESEEFYHIDIIGLEVRSNSGKKLGVVKAMHNFGAGDIIDIILDKTKKREMYQFNDKTIPEVNIDGGYVVLVLPDEIVVQE